MDGRDKEMAEMIGKGASALGMGLLFSLAVGFALGILFAPQSGAETRRQIANRAQDMRDRASGMMDRTRNMMAHRKNAMEAKIS
jgi:gas vesicle protein